MKRNPFRLVNKNIRRNKVPDMPHSGLCQAVTPIINAIGLNNVKSTACVNCIGCLLCTETGTKLKKSYRPVVEREVELFM